YANPVRYNYQGFHWNFRVDARSAPVQTTVKSWKLLPQDPSQIAALAAVLRVPPIVAQLLLNRGVKDADTARTFLKPSLNGLCRPEALPGIREATDLIWNTLRQGKRIC